MIRLESDCERAKEEQTGDGDETIAKGALDRDASFDRSAQSLKIRRRHRGKKLLLVTDWIHDRRPGVQPP